MARRKDIDSIKSFLDDLWKQAQGMLAKGRRKTEEVAHAAQVKMDMYLLSSKKGDLYRQLGESFFVSSRRKKPSVKKQQKLFSIIQEIQDIELHEKSLRKALKRGGPAKEKKAGRPAGRKRGRPAGKGKGKGKGKVTRGRPRGRKPATARGTQVKPGEKPTA